MYIYLIYNLIKKGIAGILSKRLANEGYKTIADINRKSSKILKADFVSWLKNDFGANKTEICSLVSLVHFTSDPMLTFRSG